MRKTSPIKKPKAPTTARKKPAIPSKKPAAAAPTDVFVELPVCTQEVYASASGLPEGVVRGHVEKKLLPTVKLGRHRMINLAALKQRCLEADAHE